MSGLFLILVLATIGLFVSAGNYDPVGLFCYTLSLVGLTLHVIRLLRGRQAEPSPRNWTPCLALYFAGVALSQAWLEPVVYALWERGFTVMRMLAAVTAFLAISLLLAPRRWQKPLMALALASVISMYVTVPLTSPLPKIDVYYFQTEAARAVLAGTNPYQMDFTNVYGHSVFYPSGKPDSYPYPPLSIAFAIAGVLTGDVRWPLIACHLGASFLLFRTGLVRGLSFEEAALVSFSFLYLPRAPFVLEWAWTEPSVVFAIGLFSYFLARSRLTPALFSAGIALALKQTAILLLPFIWALFKRAHAWKELLLLFAPIIASYGIFVSWDPEALWNDVVRFHLVSPVRLDALTYSALVYRLTGSPLPVWLSGAALLMGIATGVSILLKPREKACADPLGMSVFFAAASLAYLATLLFSKHAFTNYYYMLQYLLLSTVLWARAAEKSDPTRTPA